jgi:cell division protein ZapA (FtsZ GTPase activity inhibitor)
MMLDITYAFIGFIMGGIAIIISLYALLTLDEMKQHGKEWVKLNRELRDKINKLEKGGAVTPWKK